MIATFQIGELGRILNAPVPPLDGFASGLVGAYAFRRLLSSYTGPLIRVRDSTSGTEYDIGYGADGTLNLAQLFTNIGAHNATIAKFYDQSGGGNNLQQTTGTKQPVIVNASNNFLGYALFDGGDDFMSTANTSGGTNTAFTAFIRAHLRSLIGSQMVLEHTADTNSNNGADWFNNNSTAQTHYAVARNSVAQIVSGSWTGGNSFNLNAMAALRVDVTEAVENNKVKNYYDGALTSSGTANTGSPVGAFANANYYVGARGGVSVFAGINLYELMLYQGATGLSAATIAAITKAMK